MSIGVKKNMEDHPQLQTKLIGFARLEKKVIYLHICKIMPKSGHENFIIDHLSLQLAKIQGKNKDHPWFHLKGCLTSIKVQNNDN